MIKTLRNNIVSDVISSAMHIIYDSDFTESVYWPKKGIKIGNGLSSSIRDCLWLGCNAYGYENEPVIGRIGLRPGTQAKKRVNKQFEQIEMVLDQSIYEGIYFEHELTKMNEFIWLTFIIS